LQFVSILLTHSHAGVGRLVKKAVRLVCGQFNLDRHPALPALRALPQAVTMRVGMEAGYSPMSDTLRMLRREVETPNFGNEIVVRNHLLSLFVYSMRDWAEAVSPAANDWFSAVRSPYIERALARIHEAPERAWILEELAQEAVGVLASFSGTNKK
jgi:hypothetical protein